MPASFSAPSKENYMTKLISEPDVRRAALRELQTAPMGFRSTTDLIVILTSKMSPQGKDSEFAQGRSDTYFSQKVRNLVSHRMQGPGLERMGYADYDSFLEGWTITEKGKTYIQSR